MKARQKLGLLLIRMDQKKFPLCGCVESVAALGGNTGRSPLIAWDMAGEDRGVSSADLWHSLTPVTG